MERRGLISGATVTATLIQGHWVAILRAKSKPDKLLGGALSNLNRLAETRQDGSGSCRWLPGVKCLASEDAKRSTRCQMALYVEGVVGGGMNSQEALS